MGGGKRSEGGGGGKGGKCVWRGYNIPDLASLITRLVLRYVGIGRDSATVSYSRHYGRAASGWHAGPGRSGSSGGLGARHHRHRSLKPALGRGCGSAGPGGPGCGPRVAEATARAAGPMLYLVTESDTPGEFRIRKRRRRQARSTDSWNILLIFRRFWHAIRASAAGEPLRRCRAAGRRRCEIVRRLCCDCIVCLDALMSRCLVLASYQEQCRPPSPRPSSSQSAGPVRVAPLRRGRAAGRSRRRPARPGRLGAWLFGSPLGSAERGIRGD